MLKFLLFIVYVLVGLGRNTPGEWSYYLGIGFVDVLMVLIFVFAVKFDRDKLCDIISKAKPIWMPIGIMLIFAGSSAVINIMTFGISFNDVFEVFKILFLMIFMLVTTYLYLKAREFIIFGFLLGVILSGIIALLNPMNPDVLGTPQMFNPNVIGNVLASSIVISSIIILNGRLNVGLLIALCLMILSVFTFSKGTWLMAAFAMACLFVSILMLFKSSCVRFNIYLKAGMTIMLGIFIVIVVTNWDILILLVRAKIEATEFQATAAEGGSFSARLGLIWSSLRMSLLNPLFGVGISNFEIVNTNQKEILGSFFYYDDNPNNVFAYIVACMGWPALFLFLVALNGFYKAVSGFLSRFKALSSWYKFFAMIVFILGGMVQIEMLKAYYFWFACGLYIGLSETSKNIRV